MESVHHIHQVVPYSDLHMKRSIRVKDEQAALCWSRLDSDYQTRTLLHGPRWCLVGRADIVLESEYALGNPKTIQRKRRTS